jgi:nitroreductase
MLQEIAGMNVIEAVENRRSVRKFLEKEIDRGILEKILSAGIAAPSAKNRQPWRFTVITGALRREMAAILRSGFNREKSGEAFLPHYAQYLASAERTAEIMETAPVTVLAVNAENGFSLNQTAEEKLFETANIQSIGASIQNILLAALEYGVGGLWICDIYFAYPELRAWLRTDRQIVAAVSLGYPDETPFPRPRKRLDCVVEWK